MKHEPFVGEPSPQNQIMGTRHSNLKSVKISGFCSAKSLVELTCYILEYATSLDCLTLDTTWARRQWREASTKCTHSRRRSGWWWASTLGSASTTMCCAALGTLARPRHGRRTSPTSSRRTSTASMSGLVTYRTLDSRPGTYRLLESRQGAEQAGS